MELAKTVHPVGPLMCKSKKERALKNRELLIASIGVIIKDMSEEDALSRIKKMQDEYTATSGNSARVQPVVG